MSGCDLDQRIRVEARFYPVCFGDLALVLKHTCLVL